MVFGILVLTMLWGLICFAASQRDDDNQQELPVHDRFEGRNGQGHAVNGEPRPQAGPYDLVHQRGFVSVKFDHYQSLHDTPAHQYATENGSQDARVMWSDTLLESKGRNMRSISQRVCGFKGGQATKAMSRPKPMTTAEAAFRGVMLDGMVILGPPLCSDGRRR